MTPSPDDQLDEATATAQAKKARPARKTAPDDAAKTAAVKARTAKSAATSKAATASSATANAAAKAAAAKTAAAKATAAKNAARTSAARSSAAKTAAAKAAAAKAAAAKKAAPKDAQEEAAAEEASVDRAVEIEPTSEPAAAKKPAAKRVAKPRTPRATASRAVAAHSAAAAAETVAPPATVPTTTEQSADAAPIETPGYAPSTALVVEAESAPVAEAEPKIVATAEPEVVAEPDVEAAPELEAAAEAEAEADTAPATHAENVAEEPDVDEGSSPDPVPAAVVHEFSSDVDEAFVDVESPTVVDALRVRGLVKDFGDQRAVNGIDLTVPAGSFYGIVGPNGAGKTTTLSIITGLLRSDGGTVFVSGIDQKADPLAAKRVMGVLPDRLRTFDRLTGRQLLHYYGLLRGLDARVIEKRSADLARAFDLTGALSRVVSDYSAGMTKKIMLAGAMIHSPRVLVLDEPFESVDPVSSGVILDILRAYVAHGGTVVLSSHGMDLVERVCSRVAIIVGGEVLAEGTVDEVRAGQTLESRFVELAGSSSEVEGLEWLHTFSG